MRRARLIGSSVNRRVLNLCNSFYKVVLKRPHRLHFLFQIGINLFCRNAKSGNSRNILRTRADIFLLFTTKYNWFNLYFFIDVKRSDSFWSVDFMSAHRHHIHSNSLWKNTVFPKSLNRIHMEQNVFIIILHNLHCFLDRLHGTNLIIHIHDGHENGILAKCLFQCIQTDSAILIHRQEGHSKSFFLLQIMHRI